MPPARIDAEWVDLFEGGSAHIVGILRADGTPLATRGWGIRISGGTEARLLLGATEVAALGHPKDDPSGSTIAVTCSDVATLRSAQVKGPILSVEPATAADLEVKRRYCDGFFDAVVRVDVISRALMERMEPDEVVACTFTIEEAYEQTPGPGAGRRLGTPPP